jgi:L-threonylcarbamoyladenylate synthase
VAEILSIDAASPQPDRIARAASLLRCGEMVAIPTDTLYGLAADPFQPAAVQRIFAAKGRPAGDPILLLVDSVAMALGLSRNLPASFPALVERFWPGPLTLVVEAAERVPAIVTAGSGEVGLRMPAAAVPRALARALGGPITGTSANRSGSPACRSAAEVESTLGDAVPLILDGGPSAQAAPSTVIRLTAASWEMIRPGAMERSELELFFQSVSADRRDQA